MKYNKLVRDYTIFCIHPSSQEKYDNILSKILIIMIKIKEGTIKKVEKDKKLTNMKKCDIIGEIEKKVNRIYKDIQNRIVDLFAKLNYGYCITVHKSQGSTFENVYIDMGDIFKNKREEETMKCLYTAITRTSRTLKLLLHL